MLKIGNHSDTQSQASQMLVPSHPSFVPIINPSDYFPYTNCTYTITDRRVSEHAVILFTEHVQTSERRVMKLLLSYKDTRYDLDTLEKRQHCQLEALWRNRAFSSEVYKGLAPVRKSEPSYICIGEILTDPESHELEPETEYVLVMEELPEESSLASLMSKLDVPMLRKYLILLTEHIADIHNQLLCTISGKGDEQWGTYKQLEEKLCENLALLDLIPGKSKNIVTAQVRSG